MRNWMQGNLLMLTLVALLATFGCAQEEPAEEVTAEPETEEVTEEPEPAPELRAKATLEGPEGSEVTGAVTFTQQDGQVHIVARVDNVDRAGAHGFHIHETGDCSAADFSSAGGHFAPEGNPHGGPSDDAHHAGDLGNITVQDTGTGNLDMMSSMLTVSPGPNTVVGKAVILHEGEDDLESQPSGAAGARIACGVVALAGDETEEASIEVEAEAEPEESGTEEASD